MIKKIRSLFIVLLTLAVLFVIHPATTYAHQIGGIGFTSGAVHPLFGLDHLLAMVAVGIISTQLGGKSLWTVPATFLFFMVIGGILGISDINLPFIETGIALSVLVLGVGIALSKKFPLGIALACVALFAVFHGHAHGAEIPSLAYPALYASGFVLSTAILHILGVFIGHQARKTEFSFNFLRFSGVFMSLSGLYFLFTS